MINCSDKLLISSTRQILYPAPSALLLLFSCYGVSSSLDPPWTVAHQSLLSTVFPRQECWSGLPFPSPGDLPRSGTEPIFHALIGKFFTTESLGKLSLFLCISHWLNVVKRKGFILNLIKTSIFPRNVDLICQSGIFWSVPIKQSVIWTYFTSQRWDYLPNRSLLFPTNRLSKLEITYLAFSSVSCL